MKAELSKSVIKIDQNGKFFRLSVEPWWCQNLQQLEETMKILKKNSCPYRESNPGPLGLEPNTLPPTPSEPQDFVKYLFYKYFSEILGCKLIENYKKYRRFQQFIKFYRNYWKIRILGMQKYMQNFDGKLCSMLLLGFQKKIMVYVPLLIPYL